MEAAQAALVAVDDSPEQAAWAADAEDGNGRDQPDRLLQRLIAAASEHDEGDGKIADVLANFKAEDANPRR